MKKRIPHGQSAWAKKQRAKRRAKNKVAKQTRKVNRG